MSARMHTNSHRALSNGEDGPGIAIEAVFEAGFCAAGRIVVHRGMRIDKTVGGTIARASDAEAFYFAFYPEPILSNGRQPHDQPMLSAYLPLKYSALQRIPLEGYGALLLQHDASERPRDLMLTGDGLVSVLIPVASTAELKNALWNVAALAGVPGLAASRIMLAPRALITPAA